MVAIRSIPPANGVWPGNPAKFANSVTASGIRCDANCVTHPPFETADPVAGSFQLTKTRSPPANSFGSAVRHWFDP